MPEKNLLEQEREPRKNSTHIWPQRQDSNLNHPKLKSTVKLQVVAAVSLSMRYSSKQTVFFSLLFHFRYHKIGVLVLFLHDVNDVFLEFGKLCVAFRIRSGKYHPLPDILSSVTFLCFTLLWYAMLYLLIKTTLGYLPFTWENQKFRLRNQMVRAIPFWYFRKYEL